MSTGSSVGNHSRFDNDEDEPTRVRSSLHSIPALAIARPPSGVWVKRPPAEPRFEEEPIPLVIRRVEPAIILRELHAPASPAPSSEPAMNVLPWDLEVLTERAPRPMPPLAWHGPALELQREKGRTGLLLLVAALSTLACAALALARW